jgi:purine-binding chemotaxis protein CheW
MRSDRSGRGRGTIDWTAVRERLAKAQQAVEQALDLAPERARAVMDERARALARPLETGPAAGETLDLVTFALASERYALEARHVREVVRLVDYTPVPSAPEFLLGVTNVRGEILAVMDLRKFFDVPHKGLTDLSRVLVLGHERAEFGVLADAVFEVAKARLDEILEPPASVAGIGREYLRGVTAEALVVLDGAVLLEDAHLYVDQSRDDRAQP